MTELDEQTTPVCIHDGLHHKLLLRTAKDKTLRVVVKIAQHREEVTRSIPGLETEWALSREMALPGVRRALSFDVWEGTTALVLEYIDGDTLAQWSRTQQRPLTQRLDVALSLTEALEQLHAAKIVHRDLSSTNVLIDRSHRATIIDLRQASRMDPRSRQLDSIARIEPSREYLSPELTGRTNRTVDHRTDLYSLGIVLYELFAHVLPFQETSTAGYIHSHIARVARRVSEVDPSVPSIISDMIARLMRKNADDRYQSARGVRFDIARVIQAWRAGEPTESIVLGTHDLSDTFALPHKLYGRQQGRDQLRNALEQALAGTSEMVLIEGPSGIGKTSLVEDLRAPIAQHHGWLIEGRFDMLRRSIPYEAWGQALSNLVRLLLTEDQDSLADWKKRLSEGTAGQATVLLDLVPSLELVVGPQPAVPKLPPTETQARFLRVLQNFVKVIAEKVPALVVFLDDLQWADHESLKLWTAITQDNELKHCLLVGAYRSDEITQEHPLQKILAEKSVRTRIKPAPLDQADIVQLLSDTVHRHDDEVTKLAAIVRSRTEGSPYFVREYLQWLYTADLLKFDNGWTWNLEAIAQAPIREDMADLVVQRLQRLPEHTLATLRIAACMGSEFDLSLLSPSESLPTLSAHDTLQPAVNEGVITRSDTLGRFVHDKLREAVLRESTQEENRALHRLVAQRMLDQTHDAPTEAQVCFVAEHMAAANLTLHGEKRRQMIEIQLQAARHAKATTAFHSACRFFRIAAELLTDEAWQGNDRSLMLDLHVSWAIAAYAATQFDEADALLTKARDHARSFSERIRIDRIRGEYLQTTMRFPDLVKVTISVLAECGVDFPSPETIDPEATNRQLERFRNNLLRCPIAKIAFLPEAPTPVREAIAMLSRASAMFWLAYPNAALYVSLECANLTLEHGICAGTSLGLVYLATLLCGAGDIDQAYALGEAALQLTESGTNAPDRAQVSLVFHGFITYWRHSLREVIENLLVASRAAAAVGNNLTSAYCINNMLGAELILGRDLGSLHAIYKEFEAPYFRLRQQNTYSTFHAIGQIIDCLRADAPDPTRLVGEYFNESNDLADLFAKKYHSAIGVVIYVKLQLLCFLGEFAAGWHFLQSPGIRELIGVPPGAIQAHHGRFFAAVIVLRQWNDLGEEDRNAWKPFIDTAHTLFETFDGRNALNFRGLFQTIRAERARVENDIPTAIAAYTEAIRHARTHQQSHFEALGHTLAGLFWLQQGQETYARVHMTESLAAFGRWGAVAATRRLRKQFPQWFTAQPLGTFGTSLIDTHSVIQASRAMTSEIGWERLIARIMNIVIENAGAERGVLLEVHNNDILLVARAQAGDAHVAVEPAHTVVLGSEVPLSVIHRVVRTQTHVVLDDAMRDRTHGSDPYVLSHQCRSVLCIPLVHQTSVMGVILLENNLSNRVFTPDRLELLTTLASQAAISIQNARLYSDLEQRIQELKRVESDLRTANERFRSVLRAATSYSIISTDPAGTITVFNEGAERMLGYRADEVIDRSTPLLIHDESEVLARAKTWGVANGFEALVASARRGDTNAHEWTYIRKDNTRLTVSLTVTEMRTPAGELTGFIGIARDVTEERRLEQRLVHAQKLESVGLLAGGVAHDFNNLLTPILGYAELMLDQPHFNESDLDSLNEIRNAAERARDLSRQLLAFSRKQVIELRPINMVAVVQQLLGILRRTLRENITLDVHCAASVGTVRADVRQIELIVLNLAVNAQDAMPRGGRLTIELSNTYLDDSHAALYPDIRAGEYVLLAVSDTGVGMDSNTTQRIFEPFFTTKEVGQGTGLGLATVHGVVQQHGGAISVYSEKGHGSTFKVFLPIVAERATHSVVSAPLEIVHGKETLLVVEDDGVVRKLLCSLVRNLGYQVLEAESVEHCEQISQRYPRPIDMLVTDVVMPGKNGRELFQCLKRQRPGLKVLYVSGYSAHVIGQHGALDETVHLLEKPFSLRGLASSLRSALRG